MFDPESTAKLLARAREGEPNALEGKADPRDQMGFTHVVAMDYLPDEHHVIDKPRDYDFWRAAVNAHTGKPKLAVADLFGMEADHAGRPSDLKRYIAKTIIFLFIVEQKQKSPLSFSCSHRMNESRYE